MKHSFEIKKSSSSGKNRIVSFAFLAGLALLAHTGCVSTVSYVTVDRLTALKKAERVQPLVKESKDNNDLQPVRVNASR